MTTIQRLIKEANEKRKQAETIRDQIHALGTQERQIETVIRENLKTQIIENKILKGTGWFVSDVGAGVTLTNVDDELNDDVIELLNPGHAGSTMMLFPETIVRINHNGELLLVFSDPVECVKRAKELELRVNTDSIRQKFEKQFQEFELTKKKFETVINGLS
jgi:hypothetical protein